MLSYLLENTESIVFCPVTYKHGGHIERIPALIKNIENERVTIFEHDLAIKPLKNSSFFENIDLVINFASESHVDRSIANPSEFAINNINLMINLLEYVRERNIKSKCHMLHISTDEVYGSIKLGEENIEWERPNLPSNPYSASKAAQESFAISYYKTYRIPLAIINATNMVGETQNQEKFIPKTIKNLIEGKEINIDTDEKGSIGSRKYLCVRDVARASWLASQELITNSSSSRKNNLPMKFHVAGSEEITNLNLVLAIGEILNKNPKLKISPSPRQGYDLRYELSIEKITKLGWREVKPIMERLQEIALWTLENTEWLRNDHSANV